MSKYIIIFPVPTARPDCFSAMAGPPLSDHTRHSSRLISSTAAHILSAWPLHDNTQPHKQSRACSAFYGEYYNHFSFHIHKALWSAKHGF